MNTFFGINVSGSGLRASQSAMYTLNQNISNINTEGYSRQIVEQQASNPYKTNNKTGMIGTGVDVTAVKRVREEYLDNRYWNENSLYNEWDTKSQYLTDIENILNTSASTDSSSSSNGLSTTWSNFCNSLEELSKDSSSKTTRATVVEDGTTLCEYIKNLATSLQNEKKDINSSIKTEVEEVNSYASQISDLNGQIFKAELNGSNANDLRDQRTLLVDKLSKLADVKAGEVVVGTLPDGKKDVRYQVSLNGQYLVNDTEVNKLSCYEINDGSDNDGMYGIKWDNTGDGVDIKSGEIGASIDARDGSGENGEYKGVTYYVNELSNFARTVAKAFNEGIFSDGEKYYDGHKGGSGTDGFTGLMFFTCDGKSSDQFTSISSDTDTRYSSITAFNISLSSDVKNDVSKLACSSTGGQSGNNENLSNLISLVNDSKMFIEGSADSYINSMVSTLGIDSNQASTFSSNHETFLTHIDNSRTSVSGVSQDEEEANLVKYQQAYSAAAKMISVWNDVLTSLIDNLGVK